MVEDTNGNGIADAGESILATKTTDVDGNYLFENVEPGNYVVVEDDSTLPATYTDVQDGDRSNDGDPTDGVFNLDDQIAVVLEAGEDDTDNDFIEEQLGTISGVVTLDTDNDDIGDTPQSGVTVTLTEDTNGNGVVDAGEPQTTVTTNPDGSYEFTGLEPGDYIRTKEDPSDSQSVSDEDESDDGDASDTDDTVDNTVLVTLTPGEDDTENNFVDEELASIGDFVFLDANANGIQEAGEEGLSNVIVILEDNSGNEIARDTTDGNGFYLFDDLNPDTYVVVFQQPEGFATSPQNVSGQSAEDGDNDSDASSVDGSTGNITLVGGEEQRNIDAGFFPTASIGDFVWADNNGNGLQDPTEPGIDGVTVYLLQNGIIIDTTVTADNGAYEFTMLLPGNYQVQFVASEGLLFTTPNVTGASTDIFDINTDSDADPNTGLSHTITITAGETDRRIDAGLFSPLSLGDFVWFDINNNGEFDSGETPIGDVVVTLWRDNSGDGLPDQQVTRDGVVLRDTTDDNGNYLFENLAPGAYVVQVGGANFIVGGPLEGFKTSTGNDPAPDPDDASSNTDDNGYDPGLLVGVISKAVTLSVGDEPIDDGDTDANTNLTIDFGFFLPATIGDFVWDDLDGDGIQDPNEDGINGVLVNLYLADGTLVASDTTMQNPEDPTLQGYYQFIDLTPGNYYVEFITPEGYIPTSVDQGGDDSLDNDVNGSNGLGTTPTVTIMAGDKNQDIDAGFFIPASIGDFVWIDSGTDLNTQDAGDVGLNGVIVHLYDATNDAVPFMTMQTITGPDGPGYYLFDSLPLGTYYVAFELPNGFAFVAPNQVSPDPMDVDDEKDSDVIVFSEGRTGQFNLARGQHIRDVDAGLRSTVLPVEISDFFGRFVKDDDHNALTWITALEINNDHFELERAFEGEQFELIAEVEGAGNSNTPKTYRFNDKDVERAGVYTYRLKQVDFDGQFSYHDKLVRIKVERPIEITTGVYPNPATNLVNVAISSDRDQQATIRVFDNRGRLVMNALVNADLFAGSNTYNIDVTDLLPSNYIIRIEIGEEVFNEKLLIIK